MMRRLPAVAGVVLLAITVGTGIAVEAFGFGGLGGASLVTYYPGEPPSPTTTATTTPATTATPTHTNVLFAVDMDLDASGVQPARPAPVALGAPFSVDVVMSGATIPNYVAYQVTVEYDDELLDATGLPANWNDVPVRDVSGGTPGGTVVWPSGAICDPAPTTISLIGEDDDGTATLSMTCADAIFGETTNYTGMLVQFVFQCEGNGDAAITLRGIRDTFLLSFAGATVTTYNDGVAHGLAPCGTGASPTDTPSAIPTDTPSPPPTDTPTPAPTLTATPSPTPTPRTCPEDVNGDGRVTGRDLNLVAVAMMRGYTPAADVNGDGVVNMRDIRIIIKAMRRGVCL